MIDALNSEPWLAFTFIVTVFFASCLWRLARSAWDGRPDRD